MNSKIEQLTSLGQSLWLDNIQRRQLENGELQAMIGRGDIRGMTSNPTIFNHAISNSTDYDSALTPLAWAGWDAEKIFWELVVEDIKEACDLFAPLYEESSGGDGFVSIEVSPFLANDTEATAAQAQQLWARVARPNVMVKIPATRAGIPAIRRCIAAGVNINITLIFSLERYAEVMEAYLSGLEERAAAGHPIDHIASVASFFVSRVDTKVDARLAEDSPLRGKAAIANAKLAYAEFQKTFAGDRWQKLADRGARLQRPLWASTSTKNPAYPDTLYVDNLIGAHTVNTVPPQTLEAVRDHVKPVITITQDLQGARQAIAQLEAAGISMKTVTDELEVEGVKTFADSIKTLLQTIDQRRAAAASALGDAADRTAQNLRQLDADSVPGRIWAHDPSLWTRDPAGQQEVTLRMGWLDSPEKARSLLPAYRALAAEARKQGVGRILVLGMGGSSLTAEVISSLFAAAHLDLPACLAILDSTDPLQVTKATADYPPEQSWYLVASKSGGTAEVSAAFDTFWKLSAGDGSRFLAVTDPGTSLEKLARERKFRKIVSSDETVGGRYSALTDFGLVPAALLGVDIAALLDRADWMKRQCKKEVPAARNPGMALGAVLAAAAQAGRDKITIVADESLEAFAGWIEQIIAESSGKDGKGMLPVPLEPLDMPVVYGQDRLFVYLRREGEQATGVAALRQAGYPVIELGMATPYDVGAEFFRWEMAVATACHILGVNAFDQPDVQDSKDRTKAKIAQFHSTGKLEEGPLLGAAEARQAFADLLAQAVPGSYVAINAYLPRSREMAAELQRMRVAIREKTRCAVTAGFGPRFQHSTGQFHKGGPNTGLFLQIVSVGEPNVEIPGEGMTFGTLIHAQALGDYEALQARDRKVIRVRLSRPAEIRELVAALE